MAVFPPLRDCCFNEISTKHCCSLLLDQNSAVSCPAGHLKVAQSFFQAQMEQGLQHPGQCVPVNPCSRTSRENPLVSSANILNKHGICFLSPQNLTGGFGFQKGVSDMEVPSLLQHIQLQQFWGISNFSLLSYQIIWVSDMRNHEKSWRQHLLKWGCSVGGIEKWVCHCSWSHSWISVGQSTPGFQFLQGKEAMELLPREMLTIKAVNVPLG